MPSSNPSFNVQSEVGPLRQAILHRPGLELSRLTPENIGELLFDDVLWAKKAKEEHDALTQRRYEHDAEKARHRGRERCRRRARAWAGRSPLHDLSDRA